MSETRKCQKKKTGGFSSPKIQKKLAQEDFAFSGRYKPEGRSTNNRPNSSQGRFVGAALVMRGVLFRRGVCHV